MDVYGLPSSAGDCSFPIDDLLDFSNDELFSSASASASSSDSDSLHLHLHHPHYLPTPLDNPSNNHRLFQPTNNVNAPTHFSTDFTNDLCVPTDDVAELEWLSQFVDDSFTDFPANDLSGTLAFRSDTSFSANRAARGKRSKASTNSATTWTSSPEPDSPATLGTRQKSKSAGSGGEGEVRRCSHCASEKTPQWRTGPLGPKTLCNACGVRYKSGRLVPEYRPAASPTFVLTQHSNSHRKVMELRRQKELLRQQQQQQRHQRDFEVC
ncbi:GATA transcription factor 2 [Morella rubra]|uniref:GATA transcription factor n=1 Tax=Morella rubra TaxID=262757 RepID=A0A6A1WNC2_9ROSI|nr:GATA transcription factor 2 [Morella rubra]